MNEFDPTAGPTLGHTTTFAEPTIETPLGIPSARRFDPTRELPLPPRSAQLNLEDEVERRVRKVEAHVRSRPFVTIGIALIAGFVVGRILRH